MNKIRAWFQEYSDELLYKVQWPTVPELQTSTITVLVASLMLAAAIFVMDIGFGKVLGLIYSIL